MSNILYPVYIWWTVLKDEYCITFANIIWNKQTKIGHFPLFAENIAKFLLHTAEKLVLNNKKYQFHTNIQHVRTSKSFKGCFCAISVKICTVIKSQPPKPIISFIQLFNEFSLLWKYKIKDTRFEENKMVFTFYLHYSNVFWYFFYSIISFKQWNIYYIYSILIIYRFVCKNLSKFNSMGPFFELVLFFSLDIDLRTFRAENNLDSRKTFRL